MIRKSCHFWMWSQKQTSFTESVTQTSLGHFWSASVFFFLFRKCPSGVLTEWSDSKEIILVLGFERWWIGLDWLLSILHRLNWCPSKLIPCWLFDTPLWHDVQLVLLHWWPHLTWLKFIVVSTNERKIPMIVDWSSQNGCKSCWRGNFWRGSRLEIG